MTTSYSTIQDIQPVDSSASKDEVPRLIAFYLPQYHPIPENDEWWGRGFTEWTNVTKAKPLFPSHHQPHLPADLGFYDLRLSEARETQAELAREYGIHGFCYYHYWFNGKHLLERPFNEVLASDRPDFPFCLCWANENWTRTWDGFEREVLIRQDYSEQDDREHMRWLVRAFDDPRYIRIQGKPLFLIYRATKIPDPLKTTTTLREEAAKLGTGDIFLCRVESMSDEQGDPTELGFDAAVEFQPAGSVLSKMIPQRKSIAWRAASKAGFSSAAYRRNSIFDYSEIVEQMLHRPDVFYKRFPCVTPSWDNSARRKVGATILKDAHPDIYERWLTEVVAKSAASGSAEKVVFINAWNEWAEGNHLEPCQKWGRAYLEATQRAVKAGQPTRP